MAEPLPVRRAARAMLIDGLDRVLLLHGRIHEDPPREAWYLPGGRLEAGETHEDALRRELVEEVGLRDAVVGPCVATRVSIRHGSAGRVISRTRVFLVRVDALVVDTSSAGTEAGLEWRWWTCAELADAPTGAFVPATLPSLVGHFAGRAAPRV